MELLRDEAVRLRPVLSNDVQNVECSEVFPESQIDVLFSLSARGGSPSKVESRERDRQFFVV